MCQLQSPKIWRRALIVAIPKPERPLGDPKSYRPISLLCVPFKILERPIFTRVDPMIDPLLPREQAGFRHVRSTVDYVTLLTQDIEDSFKAKKMPELCLSTSQQPTTLYGTAASPASWCSCCSIDMVHMIMEMVSNRSFTLTTGNSRRSRLRRLKDGVPQGSVLAPLLIIYVSDLPTTVSRKYAYADDLAIMHADGDWQAVEGVLTKGMATVSEYLQTWKLKLSTTKTVSAAFHLKNKEAKRKLKVKYNNETLKLKVKYNNETLPFCSEPKYLRVTGHSRIADTLIHFARSWHQASRSWGCLLAPAGVLEQQLCE